MRPVTERIARSVRSLREVFAAQRLEPSRRPGPARWSPIELLGHLVDSAVHNLVRLTEAPDTDGVYIVRAYDQDRLVERNAYREADVNDLLTLCAGLNDRISTVLDRFDSSTLATPVRLSDGSLTDLRAVATGYADHLEHHVRQLIAWE